MSTWVLIIFTTTSSNGPLQMLNDIKSKDECVRVQHVMKQTLPPWMDTRCVEVIKKETK